MFNTLVRASADAREAVLQYFAHAINLNRKRAGMQVDMLTVSSDTFIMNLQIILLQFCEPFMDAQYSKVRTPFVESSGSMITEHGLDGPN